MAEGGQSVDIKIGFYYVIKKFNFVKDKKFYLTIERNVFKILIT